MFSSPVSIRLSSFCSAPGTPPMSVRCKVVTGTFSTRSMGAGRW